LKTQCFCFSEVAELPDSLG